MKLVDAETIWDFSCNGTNHSALGLVLLRILTKCNSWVRFPGWFYGYFPRVAGSEALVVQLVGVYEGGDVVAVRGRGLVVGMLPEIEIGLLTVAEPYY